MGDKYDGETVEQLQEEADRRNLDVEGTGANGNVLREDLVKALEADGYEGSGDGDDAPSGASNQPDPLTVPTPDAPAGNTSEEGPDEDQTTEALQDSADHRTRDDQLSEEGVDPLTEGDEVVDGPNA